MDDTAFLFETLVAADKDVGTHVTYVGQELVVQYDDHDIDQKIVSDILWHCIINFNTTEATSSTSRATQKQASREGTWRDSACGLG